MYAVLLHFDVYFRNEVVVSLFGRYLVSFASRYWFFVSFIWNFVAQGSRPQEGIVIGISAYQIVMSDCAQIIFFVYLCISVWI